MPSSRKPVERFNDFNYENYENYEPIPYIDPYMCEKCEVHYANGELCATCIYNDNVEKFGIPNFDNDHWMSSPCETGQRLRRQYKILYNDDSAVSEDCENPCPVYVCCAKNDLPKEDVCGFRSFRMKNPKKRRS